MSVTISEASGDPLEGTPYCAVRRMGDGGMGEVWLAEHRQLGRQCVAKIMHAHLAKDPHLVDRVRLEAQALGRLRHPHVVSILGVGTTRFARPFIVMEYLKGRTLHEELEQRGGALPVTEAISYACQFLAALGAAHEIGLVHRDVKPRNMFICEDPLRGRVLKLLDFGVVRVMPGAPQEAPAPVAVPTGDGIVVGTPAYVSPETVVGQRADPRADLYSAGLVLYLMLAGRGPFDHISEAEELLHAQAFDDPPPPSRFARTPVPPELDQVVLHALSKNPDERFQNADDFIRSLRNVAHRLSHPQGWALTTAFDFSLRAKPFPEGPAHSETPPIPAMEQRGSSLGDGRPKAPISRVLLAAVFVAAALVTIGVAAAILALARALR